MGCRLQALAQYCMPQWDSASVERNSAESYGECARASSSDVLETVTCLLRTKVVKIMPKLLESVNEHTQMRSYHCFTYANKKPKPTMTPYPTACVKGGAIAMLLCYGCRTLRGRSSKNSDVQKP